MYEKIILSLKDALAAAETTASTGGDNWTDEIKEVLQGVQRSENAAAYAASYKALIEKHIPQDGVKMYFSFSDAGTQPDEIIIEKNWNLRRYPFDQTTAEKSISEAVKRWNFEAILTAS
ncbi:MAG: hypothetical protein K5982_01540 [Selenomonadaceae bacterium]|nr:hypothetical protein [Selenomonadaceae bacterium]